MTSFGGFTEFTYNMRIVQEQFLQTLTIYFLKSFHKFYCNNTPETCGKLFMFPLFSHFCQLIVIVSVAKLLFLF